MNAAPYYVVSPCDLMHTASGFFAAWVLMGRHDTFPDGWSGHRTVAEPIGAHRCPQVVSEWAEAEAMRPAGFFQTVLMTDSLGRIVGKWSSTTFPRKDNPDDGKAPRGSENWPSVRVQVDLQNGVAWP